ncbi:VOC family protein [Nocardioides sp.]|uniref:VOC family protein n=1 Tax=Nocardioides sp. TaxID=35761 RepID=UPI002726DC90|nr:VOC family protein [Nocardioides sp.]MDO9456889.1 VOC family protein [Nocardioides sp.]
MPSIRSILLASADPDRLRAWYVDALGHEPDADGFLDPEGVGLLVDGRDDVAPATVEPGRVVLNHHVPSIAAAAARLDERGATWVSPVELRDAGLWFGTVEDPDGNYVQLIETTPSYWRQKDERAGRVGGPLSHARAAVRLPAQDLDRARRWYADVLGLEPAEERDGGLRYACGGTSFVVFASTGSASGAHTQMGFDVDGIDDVVAELTERGVVFESDVVDVAGHYPSSGASGERATWFRDSEGNLLGLGELVRPNAT